MPFTLAHVAAAVPLKKRWPRLFDQMALIVGSVVPDAGYVSEHRGWDSLAHRFVGGFEFCLPVGLGMLAMISLLKSPFEQLLPAREREIIRKGFPREKFSPVKTLLSLMIGIWTHQAWDSFTHKQGWLVEHFAPLRAVLFSYNYENRTSHALLVSHVLWYASSFAGISYLAWAYLDWLKRTSLGAESIPGAKMIQYGLLVGASMIPVEVFHHLVKGMTGASVVLAGSFLVVAGSLFYLGRDLRQKSGAET